jgi:N-acetylmuramoyl-L-alanine amidase
MSELLKKGSEGPEVESIQRDLASLGYVIAADGVFGDATDAAVRLCQKENGVDVDGIVGPETRAAIAQQSQDEQLLREGASNAAVRQVQTILDGAGYDVGTIDGVFGPKLAAAVKVLQEKHGTKVDGIIGPKTWRALKSL